MTKLTRRLSRLGWIALLLACLSPLTIPTAAQSAPAETDGARDETKASRVTIQAKGIPFDQALKILREQTGNAIHDLREPIDAEAANPRIDLDLKDAPFLEALDDIARRASVALTPFTGDGSIGIVAGEPPAKEYIDYAGPFRFELKRFAAQRDYQTGAATAGAVIEASWEPRLRPMLLSLKAANLEIRDDQDRAARPQVASETTEVVLRPETPSAELTVNLEAPERSAKTLAMFKATAEATMPVGIETFQFPSLAESNAKLKEGDVEATLVKTEVDGHVWRTIVELGYPKSGPAFESFRQGLFNNRIGLVNADGARVELNGGFSTVGAGEGRLRFEYLFLDVPGKPEDYRLVYEAASRLAVVPLEFEFRNVPLP